MTRSKGVDKRCIGMSPKPSVPRGILWVSLRWTRNRRSKEAEHGQRRKQRWRPQRWQHAQLIQHQQPQLKQQQSGELLVRAEPWIQQLVIFKHLTEQQLPQLIGPFASGTTIRWPAAHGRHVGHPHVWL